MYEIKAVLKMSDLAFQKIAKRTCKYHLAYINSNISEKRPLHLSDLTERKLLENRKLFGKSYTGSTGHFKSLNFG